MEPTQITPDSVRAHLPLTFGAGSNVRPLVAGRYRLDGILGEGAEGAVYEAADLLTGDTIAVKLVVGDGSNLRREFETARTLGHPNVVRVLACGPAPGNTWYLAMELVRGPALDEAVNTLGRAALPAAAVGCARALMYLHDRGFVHGDLKPANVRVESIEGRNISRLLDFGFADTAAGGLRGTPAYLAPELLCGGTPSPQSDLFALGVSLYEALSGTNPFLSESVSETLQKIQTVTPPRLNDSAGLSSTVRRLMARDPAQRPESARALLAELLEIPGATPSDDTPVQLGPGPLLEREADLARLRRVVDTAGSAAVISGRGGVGKTRIARELVIQMEGEAGPALVVHGSQPQPLKQLLTGLELLAADNWRRSAEDDPEGHDAARAVIRSGWLDGRPADTLGRFIGRVVGDTPFLTVIDGVDALPDDTAQILPSLLPALTTGKGRLAVCAQHVRPTLAAVLESAPGGCVSVELQPLSLEGATRLLRSLLGSADARADSAFAQLHEAVEGLPKRLREAVKQQLDSGGLSLREGRIAVMDGFDRLTAEELTPRRTHDLSALQLGANETVLACTLALLPDVTASETVQALSHSRLSSGPSIDSLVSRRIVRREADGLTIANSGLVPVLRAEASKRLPSAALIDIADHLLESGADMRLRAAELLYAAGALGRAMRLAREEADSATADGRRARALEALRWLIEHQKQAVEVAAAHLEAGDLALAMDRFEDARQHLEAALSMTSGRRGPIIRKLGWTWTAAGDYAEATPILSEALAVLQEETEPDGVELQKACFALGWTLMMAGDYDGAMGLAEQGFATVGDAGSGARLHRLQGTIHWHCGRGPAAAKSFKSGVADASRANDEATRADCEMGLGTALRMSGQADAAASAYGRAIEINRSLGRLVQVGKSLNGLGIVRYLQGRWSDAIAAWESYRDVCVPLGDRVELTLAWNNLGFLYKDRGELERSEQALVRGLGMAEAANFERGRAMLLGNLGETRTLLGEFEEARESLEKARGLAVALDIRDEVLETDRRLADLLRRAERLDEAEQAADQVLLQAETANNDGEAARALMILGAVEFDKGLRDQAGRTFETAEARFDKAGERFGVLQARFALAPAWSSSDPVRAQSIAEGVHIEANALGARGLALQAQELTDSLANTGSGLDSRILHALRLAGRFGRILDQERLLWTVTETAIELCNADRGVVLLLDADGEATVSVAMDAGGNALPGDSLRVSRTVAGRVHREGRALAIRDVAGDERVAASDSIRELRLTSILCVPLISGDQRLGILYVDSCSGASDLGEGELVVLEALAAQAATAVVNARLFADERRKQYIMRTTVHEMRSPLTGFKGVLDYLREQLEMTDEIDELVGAVRGQLERLERLTEAGQRLYRLMGGEAANDLRTIDVGLTVAEAVRPQFGNAHKKQQELSLDVDEGLPYVHSDSDLLAQVVTNLVSNAVHYTPAGGRIEVTAQLRSHTDTTWRPGGDDEVIIVVGDDGPGVPESEREHIFNWCERGQAGLAADNGGEGIGLAIAREVMRALGGRLTVSRSPLGGASFTAVLPCTPTRKNRRSQHADFSR